MNMKTLSTTLLTTLALSVSACAQEDTAATAPTTDTAPVANPFLGKADAEVTLLELGAPTCPGCKAWHDMIWPDIKSEFIDTNKIKFVFKVLPSHNPPVDSAIAGIAHCSGASNYYSVLDRAFEDQQKIELQSREGKALEAMYELGSEFGLNEDTVKQCMSSQENIDYITGVQDEAKAKRANGTPSFYVNGKAVNDPRYDALANALNEALGETSEASATPEASEEAPVAAE